MPPLVSVKNAFFTYDDAQDNAVNDVSLDILPGSFVAILGHNGSGKSTLAKLVNALFIPQSGSVSVSGMDTADEANTWEIRRRAGMVFQNPDNQLVASIVEEDVAFGLENIGVPPQEMRARVDAALKAVRMSEYALAAPSMLSGGQKQRVAIAGILAMRPELIVFDESTAMLDPSGREEVLNVVRRLNREEHITVLWITHFMSEAAYADRVVVMDDGRIQMDGTPREVFGQVERVKALGLDVPEMTELALELRTDGIALPDILTIDEMVDALCR